MKNVFSCYLCFSGLGAKPRVVDAIFVQYATIPCSQKKSDQKIFPAEGRLCVRSAGPSKSRVVSTKDNIIPKPISGYLKRPAAGRFGSRIELTFRWEGAWSQASNAGQDRFRPLRGGIEFGVVPPTSILRLWDLFTDYGIYSVLRQSGLVFPGFSP